jgi:hypothetical protein
MIGWLLILACLLVEHWIARRRSLNWINVAFFRLNAVVSMVFLAGDSRSDLRWRIQDAPVMGSVTC